MQLTVLGTKANQSGTDTNTIDSVLINFRISELFENVNAQDHDCSIKVLYSDFQGATTPDAQAALVQNQLVSEINSGQLVINWSGYNYNSDGATINSVDVQFSTYDNKDNDNNLKISDSLNVTYAQFQTDMSNGGVVGLIADIKQHLITEFTPAS